MRQLIDPDKWERRDLFNFFRAFICPCVSVTVNIDCTHLKASSKAKGFSISQGLMYATMKATNEIEEFRYRLEGEEIVLYDTLDLNTVVKNNKGLIAYLVLPYQPSFEDFLLHDSPIISEARQGRLPELAYNDNLAGEVLLSITPWMRFTALQIATAANPNENTPIITIGKIAQLPDGRWDAPLNVYVHHGFVDGEHLGYFIDTFQQVVDSL